MLDLKAKLLAAGVVTADHVKRVEDEEAQKKAKAKEMRERKERERIERMERAATRASGKDRRDDDDPDEKRARREHEWNEAQRWRTRLDALKAAGKSDQYEAIRGWVMRDRLDNAKITDAAVRFHFAKEDGAVAHLTVEPDVQAQLTAGSAAVVAFMGYNGLEHAVVTKSVADDVRAIRPDWLRHLAGVTDLATADTDASSAPADTAEASAETSTATTPAASTESPT
jgi:hypothetical protein